MPWDQHALAYTPIPTVDATTTVASDDLFPLHDTSENKVVRITAEDLFDAIEFSTLTAVDLAGTVTTSGSKSWYNVTGTSTITLNESPDDGNLVRVTLYGVNSVAMVGTINGLTDPNLTGDKNSFDIVYVLTASEWKIV